MATYPRYSFKDYTVGWLCALYDSELGAARRMLDNRHEPPEFENQNDDNQYYFGDIYQHNVVIACLPIGLVGITAAQKLVQPLTQSFPNMVLHLFVGVGGGIPRNPRPQTSCKDIRLGDVVIGWTKKTGHRPLIQQGFIRNLGDGKKPELLTYFDKPHPRLLHALTSINSDLDVGGQDTFECHLQKLAGLKEFEHPGLENDRLYEAGSVHDDKETDCGKCNGLVNRPQRETKDPKLHLGAILSDNMLVQDAGVRDKLGELYPDAMCIEMEAAGVADTTHCLVVRGISDYADAHRVTLKWHHYAAGTAAALAREILKKVRPTTIQTPKPKEDDIRDTIDRKFKEGKTIYSQFPSSKRARDLYSALEYFKQAHDILVKSDIHEPSLNAKILFRLITVEVDISHDHNINLDDRITHCRKAEDYAFQALSLSVKKVLITQIRLEQAFAEGRKAELKKQRGADTAETRVVMEKVNKDMKTSFAELRALSPKKSKEYEQRVTHWEKERLQIGAVEMGH